MVAAYTPTDLERELRQSELITDLFQFSYDPGTGEAVQVLHQYAIILSQRDFEAKLAGQQRDLNGVLVYEVEAVPDVRVRLPGGDILRRIRRHGEERYHYLQEIPAALDRLGQVFRNSSSISEDSTRSPPTRYTGNARSRARPAQGGAADWRRPIESICSREPPSTFNV
jgi:hypothetical protein